LLDARGANKHGSNYKKYPVYPKKSCSSLSILSYNYLYPCFQIVNRQSSIINGLMSVIYSDSQTASPGSILRQDTGSGIYGTPSRFGDAPESLPPMAVNVSLTIERRLPALGEVIVAPNQTVVSDTILARALLPGRPQVFNLSEIFEENPKDLSKRMLKQVGERVKAGELIAQRKGLGGKSFKAPFDATLSVYDEASGYISLTPQPEAYNLEAFVRGTITGIIPSYGATVQVQANYARGAFGFGGERHGVLRVLANKPGDPIDPAAIDPRTTYFILLGGSYITAEVMKKAVEMKVRGIITGSVREEELVKFLSYRKRQSLYRVGQYAWRFPADISGQDSPFTLVVTEGFGMRPMASRLFEMLVAHDGEELSINGTTRLRRGWQRPEIVVPVLTRAEVTRAATKLTMTEQLPRPGSIVRLINPTYLGAVGQVVSLPPSRRGVSPGQLDRLAEVEVQGTRLVLPFADIEVLEQPVAAPPRTPPPQSSRQIV
jgi:hypothetical protein